VYSVGVFRSFYIVYADVGLVLGYIEHCSDFAGVLSRDISLFLLDAYELLGQSELTTGLLTLPHALVHSWIFHASARIRALCGSHPDLQNLALLTDFASAPATLVSHAISQAVPSFPAAVPAYFVVARLLGQAQDSSIRDSIVQTLMAGELAGLALAVCQTLVARASQAMALHDGLETYHETSLAIDCITVASNLVAVLAQAHDISLSALANGMDSTNQVRCATLTLLTFSAILL
jgi:hypothetical protein